MACTGGKISLCGQINPSKTICQGTPEMVREEARRALEVAGDCFILSSGCEVSKMTPYKNFLVIDITLHI